MTTGEEAGALAVAREIDVETAIMRAHAYTGGTADGMAKRLCAEFDIFPKAAVEALITREKIAAVEQERERCAKVAERDCTNSKSSTLYVASARIAAAIRATSPQDGKEG